MEDARKRRFRVALVLAPVGGAPARRGRWLFLRLFQRYEIEGAPMEATVPAPPVESLAKSLKLLADETRLRILYHLRIESELNVRMLCDRVDQSQPAVSHHLALLKEHGLITCRRSGKHNFYSIVPRDDHDLLETILRSLAPAP